MAESIETRHENWLRVVWGLLYVREGLQGYVNTKGKQQYHTFMNNVNAKCNSQTCNQCQINSTCKNGNTKVTGKSRFRPNHFCDEMYKEIQINHATNKPFMINTDSTKWQDPHVGYWEVAKCYLSTSGYFDKTGPNQVDASGLLNICINSSFIKQQINNIQHFEEVRGIRNKILHDAYYELDGQKADDYLDKMIKVVEDPQELMHDTFANQAAIRIRMIKDKTKNTPTFMTEALHKWLGINSDVDNFLTEIEGLIYDRLHKDLKGFIVDEVEREVKHKIDDRGNDEREQKVQGLRHQLVKYYQQQLNSTPISHLLSDKDEKLDNLYVPPKIVEQDPRKVGSAAKEQGKPVTSYREMFCKEGKLMKHVFIVGEAGMGKSSCATMCALRWANQFSSTKTSNYTDGNTSHQTQFQRLRSKWQDRININNDSAHTFCPEKEQNNQFQDDLFYKEIDFIFHLHLRDSGDLCNMTDMIRDQLISRIYQKDELTDAFSTMMYVLHNYTCLIIADGLDEWSHPDGTNCNCTTEDKVVPYLAPTNAIVLITSRPWRMSQQRVQDTKIDKYLEIEGTSDIKLLIQKILNSLNETVSEKKTSENFFKFVDIMKLNCLLSVPILSMLLVCLWFEGILESSSLCDIYALFIEMMFVRKHRHVPVVPKTDIQLPRCFKNTKCVQNNYNIVKNMAELAFTKKNSNDRTSFLVFKEVDILAQDNIKFLLQSGILQESKSASLISEQSSYSFIHKTVQEFLAAIHMYYHPNDLHIVLTPFYEKNGERSDISHVFVFMCGLNIKLANKMYAMISNNLSLDNQSFVTETRVIQIQSTIASGYKEATASQELDIKLSLSCYDFSYTSDTEILDDLLSMNKSNVRYIKTSIGQSQAKLQEVFSKSSDTLTNVKIVSVAGHFDLLACKSLKCLSIYGT